MPLLLHLAATDPTLDATAITRVAQIAARTGHLTSASAITTHLAAHPHLPARADLPALDTPYALWETLASADPATRLRVLARMTTTALTRYLNGPGGLALTFERLTAYRPDPDAVAELTRRLPHLDDGERLPAAQAIADRPDAPTRAVVSALHTLLTAPTSPQVAELDRITTRATLTGPHLVALHAAARPGAQRLLQPYLDAAQAGQDPHRLRVQHLIDDAQAQTAAAHREHPRPRLAWYQFTDPEQRLAAMRADQDRRDALTGPWLRAADAAWDPILAARVLRDHGSRAEALSRSLPLRGTPVHLHAHLRAAGTRALPPDSSTVHTVDDAMRQLAAACHWGHFLPVATYLLSGPGGADPGAVIRRLHELHTSGRDEDHEPTDTALDEYGVLLSLALSPHLTTGQRAVLRAHLDQMPDPEQLTDLLDGFAHLPEVVHAAVRADDAATAALGTPLPMLGLHVSDEEVRAALPGRVRHLWHTDPELAATAATLEPTFTGSLGELLDVAAALR